MSMMPDSLPMTLGEAGMDQSHQALEAALNTLAQADDADFARCFISLTARFEADFRAEEERMEEIDFAGLASHREQHARVLSALHHARPRIEAGDIAEGRRVVRLLPQWLQFHIWTMDSALAAALLLASDVQAEAVAPQAGSAPCASEQELMARLLAMRSTLARRIQEQLRQAEQRISLLDAHSAPLIHTDVGDDLATAMLERDLASLAEVETAIRQKNA